MQTEHEGLPVQGSDESLRKYAETTYEVSCESTQEAANEQSLCDAYSIIHVRRKTIIRWDLKNKKWRRVIVMLGGERRLTREFVRKCHGCGRAHLAMHEMSECRDCSFVRHCYQAGVRGPASYAVAKAVKLGQLPKLDGSIACVDCGGIATDYEHRDYSKPLDVEPVCRSCNKLRGPAKGHESLVLRRSKAHA